MPKKRHSLRDWLEKRLEENDIPGLYWIDFENKKFQIPWIPISLGFTQKNVFKEWAIHAERFDDSKCVNQDFTKWKHNFRCAIKKANYLQEIYTKEKDNETQYKVYKFIDPKRNISPNPKDDLSMFHGSVSPLNQCFDSPQADIPVVVDEFQSSIDLPELSNEDLLGWINDDNDDDISNLISDIKNSSSSKELNYVPICEKPFCQIEDNSTNLACFSEKLKKDISLIYQKFQHFEAKLLIKYEKKEYCSNHINNSDGIVITSFNPKITFPNSNDTDPLYFDPNPEIKNLNYTLNFKGCPSYCILVDNGNFKDQSREKFKQIFDHLIGGLKFTCKNGSIFAQRKCRASVFYLKQNENEAIKLERTEDSVKIFDLQQYYDDLMNYLNNESITHQPQPYVPFTFGQSFNVKKGYENQVINGTIGSCFATELSLNNNVNDTQTNSLLCISNPNSTDHELIERMEQLMTS